MRDSEAIPSGVAVGDRAPPEHLVESFGEGDDSLCGLTVRGTTQELVMSYSPSKERGVVLDVSEVYRDEGRARRVGQERKQDGIYHIGHGNLDLRSQKSWDISFNDWRRDGRGVRADSRRDVRGVGLQDSQEKEAVKGGIGSGNFGPELVARGEVELGLVVYTQILTTPRVACWSTSSRVKVARRVYGG